MQNTTPTAKTAAAIITTKLTAAKAKLVELEATLGTIAPDEIEKAKTQAMEDMAAMDKRQWFLLSLSNTKEEIKNLEITAKADLIFPAGKFLLLPKGEKLISPAGFHPDEKVFIKPSAGAIVDKLPKASNFAYYDFT